METLHAFPLADHWVVLRPGSDKLALLNATASEVLEANRRGLGATEIGEAWALRYGLDVADAAAAASRTLASLREIGMLGTLPSAPRPTPRAFPRARIACGPNAPVPWVLRMGLHPFTLRFADVAVRDRLAGVVQHLRVDAPASGPSLEVLRDGPDYVLNCDGFEVYRSADLDAVTLVLAYHSTEIAQRDETQLFVMHAGAVARDGRCVAFAGVSGRGKSTLTTYLASHGYDFLADDMLPIDEATLLAEPAPACIALKAPAWPIVTKFRPDLEKLPILQGTYKKVRLLPPPLPSRSDAWQSRHELASIVFVEYSEGSPTNLTRMSAPSAVQALIDSQAYFARPLRPARIERMVRWIEHLPAYRLCYGSLIEIPERLAPLLQH